MKWIIREQQLAESEYNAGSKARNDVDSIMTKEGYKPLIANMEPDTSCGVLRKAWLQLNRYMEWKKSMSQLSKGDTVVIQYPIRNHTIFFGSVLKAIQKKDVSIIGIIHDLETLRLAISKKNPPITKARFKFEELSALKHFSRIIVHNDHMKNAIHDYLKVPMERMVNLEIFDYLFEPQNSEEHAALGGPILIAGNLDKRKSGYVYSLPQNVRFDLYGAHYDNTSTMGDNVHYMGRVNPDELPNVLYGSFGLVWDGPRIDTCAEVYGEYLKYNNPHKASLYLAAGIPIIVWKQSALADYVMKNRCGISIDSLERLSTEIGKISLEDYETMKVEVHRVSNAIRNGEYLRTVVSNSLL